jgi:hypothetical protein
VARRDKPATGSRTWLTERAIEHCEAVAGFDPPDLAQDKMWRALICQSSNPRKSSWSSTSRPPRGASRGIGYTVVHPCPLSRDRRLCSAGRATRRYLLHDRDTKYTQSFRAIIASGQVEPLVLPARSPNLNAYSERWVRSVKEAHTGTCAGTEKGFQDRNGVCPRDQQSARGR